MDLYIFSKANFLVRILLTLLKNSVQAAPSVFLLEKVDVEERVQNSD